MPGLFDPAVTRPDHGPRKAVGPGPATRAKRLTADLTVSDVDAVPFADGRQDILNGLFDPVELGTIDPKSVITIGTAGRRDDAPWYSFDIKGGSFLARPSESKRFQASDTELLPLKENAEGLPNWDDVDACLDAADGARYLFNNHAMVYTVLGDTTEHPIGDLWGLRKSKLLAEGQGPVSSAGGAVSSSCAAAIDI